MESQTRFHAGMLAFYGSLFILATTLLSSCRIGNHVETASQPETLTGYYLTQPQALTLYLTTDQDTEKTYAPTQLIPPEIGNTFTNPMIFKLVDTSTGSSLIASNAGQYILPIYIDSDLTLSYQGSTSPSTYWQDPDCQSYLELTQIGNLVRDPSLSPPSGFSGPISGKIELTIQVSHRFQGNCTTTLQTLADCYLDSQKCGGQTPKENSDLQLEVTQTFEPYIQMKLITGEDISKVTNYAYEVVYK